MPRGKTRKASPVQELSGAVGDFLAQAQVTLKSGWKAAAEALPASPDKVVQGLSKRVNKTVKNLQQRLARVESKLGGGAKGPRQTRQRRRAA